MGRQPQCVAKRFGVRVVLMKGVLERKRVLVQGLCPLFLMRRAKDPTAHVLCFDDKYPAGRHHDMINLGGAIERRQCDIFDPVIIPLCQAYPKQGVDDPLPDHAFHPSGLGNDLHKRQYNDQPEHPFRSPR